MEIDFSAALLLVGIVLAIAAGLSGWLRGTVLSISVLAVVAGAGLSLAGVASAEPSDPTVVHLVELALILTLFSDGLFAERELLQSHWGPPARALVIAMPITGALLALAARLLFPELSWAEAFLLGAVLAPTDPVVSSSVVTAKRVPPLIRHTLNLESGLNDGLALPLVLIFLVLAAPGGDAGGAAVDQLGETLAGAAIGIGVALIGGAALDRLPGGRLAGNYEGVYGLGLALLAFGVADVTIGNGLIAAFVAGIGLAYADRQLPDAFGQFNESLSAVFQVITFLIFGALVATNGFDGSALALAAFITFALLVARPLAVWLAFLGLPLPDAQKLFIAWFGPKGVASMLFALFVLASAVPGRELVFEVASLVILTSIIAHGLTDTIGARWVARRLEAQPG